MEWLEYRVDGFAELNVGEREAIYTFTMLWSFFEAQHLNCSASSKAIRTFVQRWLASGVLDPAALESYLTYFRDRYFVEGEETPHFQHLRLRRGDAPELVKAVLNRTNDDTADKVFALLVVVYRLRNNLFHGYKWSYRLRDQQSNFVNASHVLMVALLAG